MDNKNILKSLGIKVFRKELRIAKVPTCNLKWLNLEGRTSPTNPKGARSFELRLTRDDAIFLHDLKWRVKKRGWSEAEGKFVNSDDMDDFPGDEDRCEYKLKVNVNYDSDRPPVIYRVAGNPFEEHAERKLTKREMFPNATNTERDLGMIDGDAIIAVDLILSGWTSSRDGKISAYLQRAMFFVEENEILDEWSRYELEDDDEDINFDEEI